MKYYFSLFIIGLSLCAVSAFAQTQKINTIAGDGIGGFSGDGGAAPAASLWGPLDVVVDNAGNVYIADFYNNRIRKISITNGIITTVAGNGNAGFSGNGTFSTTAELTPYGIALDKHGNIFYSDANYSVVRKISPSFLITTVAGNGLWGYAGDGGPATLAKLRQPYGITVDDNDNLYIADAGNHVIRKVDATGVISTIAGVDTAGFSGDGDLATLAKLDSPYAVAFDRKGNLFINDFYNNRIRKVDTGQIITTYAGDGTYGGGGDGGSAVLAQFNKPKGICVDTFGNLYIADADNNVVRKVDTNGIITRVAGNGTFGFGGDLGYVDGANFSNPYGVAVDVYGSIFIADANNQRIRKTYDPNAHTAVNTVKTSSGISVSPNPFTRQFAVIGLDQSDRVFISDILGRQVNDYQASSGLGNRIYELHDEPAGVYILQVYGKDGNSRASFQLVKE